MCLDNKNNLNAQFEKFNLRSTSLGIGGNGPLIEFATFKEYESLYEYKTLILFITPDNDFYDLLNESNNKILMNYLNNPDFKQNISLKQNKKAKRKVINSFFGNKTNRFANDFFSVYHFNLKRVFHKIKSYFKNENIANFDQNYLNDKDLDILFLQILNKFHTFTKNKNINFYVVFNSIYPNIIYPKTDTERIINSKLRYKIEFIKKYLDKNKIEFFDFNEFIDDNYNKSNISDLFNKINGQWNHYSKDGNYIFAKEIAKSLIKK